MTTLRIVNKKETIFLFVSSVLMAHSEAYLKKRMVYLTILKLSKLPCVFFGIAIIIMGDK